MRIALIVSMLCAWLPGSLAAVGGYRDLNQVDPSVYVSADGRWQWRIDPQRRNASGEARYELSRDGELLRSLVLPYTVLEAKVSADGMLLGHALFGEVMPGYGYRELLVARVQVDGQASVLLREPRKEGIGFHSNEVPHPRGSALDEAEQRFLLEVEVADDGKHKVQHWAFDLDGTGEKQPYFGTFAAATTEPEEQAYPLPGRRLSPLGQVELQLGAHQSAPLASHFDFRIDDAGRFGLLRWTSETQVEFLLSDPSGTVLRRWPLHDRLSIHMMELHWIDGARWLLTDEADSGTRAWWLDADSGALTSVEGFSPPPISQLVADGSGGFVAVLDGRDGGAVQTLLAAFDADGRQRWSRTIPSGGSGLAFTHGEAPIAVLTISRIDRYGPSGDSIDRIELDQAMGRALGYAASLHAGQDGSLMLEDYSGRFAFVQFDSSGRVVAELNPQSVDGATFSSVGGLQQAPDGQWWTSNGRELLRLDRGGRVVQALGQAGPDALARIAALHISPAGDIHAVDNYGGAIHRFDAQGRWLRVCRPDPGDYNEEVSLPALSVSTGGEILVSRRGDPPDALHYDADCRRVGVQRRDTNELSQAWHFAGASERRWIVGSEGITLVDGMELVQRIERTPSGHWLFLPGPATTDADGSLISYGARLPVQAGALPPAHPASFIVWSTQGKAVSELHAPADVQDWAGLSTDGRRLVYLLESDEVVVQDRQDGQAYRLLDLPFKPRAAFLVQPAIAPELWVWDGAWRLARFAVE
jgi:hypothetical protein